MTFNVRNCFDPPTIDIMRQILDEAWASLPDQRAVDKSTMAKRILECARSGERDPERLKAAALDGVADPAEFEI